MAKKQTSSRVSTLAARLMRELALHPGNEWVVFTGMSRAAVARLRNAPPWAIYVRDLRTLCASVLSQDETRGQAKKRGRK